jgi:hypothetical protein
VTQLQLQAQVLSLSMTLLPWLQCLLLPVPKELLMLPLPKLLTQLPTQLLLQPLRAQQHH